MFGDCAWELRLFVTLSRATVFAAGTNYGKLDGAGLHRVLIMLWALHRVLIMLWAMSFSAVH